MKFNLDKRIFTNAKQGDILEALESSFKENSKITTKFGFEIIVESIQPMFASFNHKDTTTIDIVEMSDGYLIQANIHYRPSAIFWIILIPSLLLPFSIPLAIILIVVYIKQKKTVQNKINDIFNRVKNKFEVKLEQKLDFEYLKKLSKLRDEGILTEQEYLLKKKESLNI